MKNWGVRGFLSLALVLALTVAPSVRAEEKQERNLGAHYYRGALISQWLGGRLAMRAHCRPALRPASQIGAAGLGFMVARVALRIDVAGGLAARESKPDGQQ